MAGRRQPPRGVGVENMTKRVIVTGASSGIGAACVDVLVEKGYQVIGVDRRPSSLADEHHVLDLSSPDCGQELMRLIGEMPIDGLVNNAALQLNKAAESTTVEEFDELCAVNLRAPLMLAGSLLPRLESARGFVVNVASVHAVATSKNISAYAATKGGLVALTRALAVEWGPRVRVNAVLPGAIETDMLLDGLSRSALTPESLADRHPLKKLGAPKDVAAAVCFLAQNEFATGSLLTVDGGATARLSTE